MHVCIYPWTGRVWKNKNWTATMFASKVWFRNHCHFWLWWPICINTCLVYGYVSSECEKSPWCCRWVECEGKRSSYKCTFSCLFAVFPANPCLAVAAQGAYQAEEMFAWTENQWTELYISIQNTALPPTCVTLDKPHSLSYSQFPHW